MTPDTYRIVDSDNIWSHDGIMIRTQISLDPDLYEDAREEAQKQGISSAEIIGRATARFWIRGLSSPERERI